MTTEERFSQSLDLFYRRRERDKHLCCRLSMSRAALDAGDAWPNVQQHRCEACGLLWCRQALPDSENWNAIVGA